MAACKSTLQRCVALARCNRPPPWCRKRRFRCSRALQNGRSTSRGLRRNCRCRPAGYACTYRRSIGPSRCTTGHRRRGPCWARTRTHCSGHSCRRCKPVRRCRHGPSRPRRTRPPHRFHRWCKRSDHRTRRPRWPSMRLERAWACTPDMGFPDWPRRRRNKRRRRGRIRQLWDSDNQWWYTWDCRRTSGCREGNPRRRCTRRTPTTGSSAPSRSASCKLRSAGHPSRGSPRTPERSRRSRRIQTHTCTHPQCTSNWRRRAYPPPRPRIRLLRPWRRQSTHR
jgi:hypothetical protein